MPGRSKGQAAREDQRAGFFLSGCDDTQTASDTVDERGMPSGALTNALLAAVDGGMNLNRLLIAIRVYLAKRNQTQVPQMSCGDSVPFDEPFM